MLSLKMNKCPCCSGELFSICCQPIIKNEKEAKTPEELMRSRYCAYALKNAAYIYNTYSKAGQSNTSLKEITAWAETCVWVNLQIHHSSPIIKNTLTENTSANTVEFSAYYIEDNNLIVMRENSFFINENGQWRYHNGEMIKHEVLNKVKRNEPCPCQQGKKFKQCCEPLLR